MPGGNRYFPLYIRFGLCYTEFAVFFSIHAGNAAVDMLLIPGNGIRSRALLMRGGERRPDRMRRLGRLIPISASGMRESPALRRFPPFASRASGRSRQIHPLP